jgi:hypothetical protein
VGVFLDELATRLADKWLSLLVLPGLLLLGAIDVGRTLGQERWADRQRLVGSTTQVAHGLSRHGPVTVGIAVVAALLAAASLGLLARGVGQLLQRIWLGNWPRWAGRASRGLHTRRLRRWNAAQDRYAAAVLRGRDGRLVSDLNVASLEDLAARRNAIALAPPSRPTWMGDRMASVEARVRAEYGLDLPTAWPRLWLVFPDSTRASLQDAYSGFAANVTLAAWGALYLLLGIIWWPAAVVGLVTVWSGWERGHEAIDVLASLVEATVDVHGRDLAAALGLVAPDVTTLEPATGQMVTRLLRKGA